MLVWADIETTGLHALTFDIHKGAYRPCDAVLEVACVVTDDALDERGRFHAVTDAARDFALHDLDPVVQEMHVGSGLWGRSLHQPDGTTGEVAARLAEFLRRVGGEGAQLAGSTVSFDRRFLEVRMPEVAALLHHRSLDVTSLNEVARRFWPAVHAHRPGAGAAPKHEALADIEASIATLRHYLREVGPAVVHRWEGGEP